MKDQHHVDTSVATVLVMADVFQKIMIAWEK